MFQDKREIQTAKAVDDNLEPYRLLIELQKQMIELVRQHETTRRECAALREQLLDEMAQPRRRQRLGQGIGLLRRSWAAWKSRLEGSPQMNGPFPLPLRLEQPSRQTDPA
jgi:DNA repair ATPase RecN